MDSRKRLPSVALDPEDLRGPWPERNVETADEVVYRLGLLALAVPGLPQTIAIEDVEVEFVRGPVRAQRTELRQRHGLPIVFDKCMRRIEVGDGELVALFSLHCTPVPENLEAAFVRWRARALAAAGMLAAVLDERVVGRELFEDAIILREGDFLGAADLRSGVRTFLPFEVGATDRFALDQLAEISLSETSAVARAARLYRRAALEGPTADAYATLWVAAECFSEHRSPSRKAIEAALAEAGMNPDGMPLHVGRLIELRAKIQHHGLEEDDRLRTAFYEMEAVVRALIRQDMKLRGGWWPATDNPAGFAEPFDRAVAGLMGPGDTQWHESTLPAAVEPLPQRLPRRVVNPVADPRLELDARIGPVRNLIASIVLDALEWQAPDELIAVKIDLRPEAPAGTMKSADATTIRFARPWLEGVEDPAHPERIVNLVWDLHALVAASLAQRAGLTSGGDGITAIEAIGAWSQYRRLITHGDFDASLLKIPSERDEMALGKLAGWAAAGDARAIVATAGLTGRERHLVQALVASLLEDTPGPPTNVLDLASQAGADLSPDE